MTMKSQQSRFEDGNRDGMNDIRLLIEGDDMLAFEPIQFDDEFKQKYKDIFSFNSPNSACMIFGKHYHKH